VPLVGTKVRMPQNEEFKKIIDDIMAEDGISIAQIA